MKPIELNEMYVEKNIVLGFRWKLPSYLLLFLLFYQFETFSGNFKPFIYDNYLFMLQKPGKDLLKGLRKICGLALVSGWDCF